MQMKLVVKIETYATKVFHYWKISSQKLLVYTCLTILQKNNQNYQKCEKCSCWDSNPGHPAHHTHTLPMRPRDFSYIPCIV
jgi:hypothetical protein